MGRPECGTWRHGAVRHPYAGVMIQRISAAIGEPIRPDSGLSIKPISVAASARIVNFAFDFALTHGRRKVTAVHKANIMKFTDGLFRQVAEEIAKEHPDIQ